MTMKLSHFVTEAMHEHPIDELAGKLETAEGVLWLDIAGVDHDASMIMSDTFGFHELAIEDTRNQNQRPKAEEYSDHLFIILNPINHGGDEQFRELDVFVGKNYVVTAHPEVEPTLELVRKRLAQFDLFWAPSIKEDKDKIRQRIFFIEMNALIFIWLCKWRYLFGER
jgi:Mg2+ and Co2+ transporter CorA